MKRQLQMSFGAKAKRQLQESSFSIGGEMNIDLSYFSAGVQTPVPVVTLSVQKTLLKEAKASARF
ncbi:hypothetical protein [Bacillus sp. RS11]|uniref:hypothetical protein n=1 Tax=Lysinibacillus sp. RS11 TaxID=3242682 RepID=UPI0035C73112